MSKKSNSPHYLTIPRVACALLSIVMVATQFLPFWEIEGKMYSISDLVWFIYKHSEIGTFLKQVNPTNSVNQAVVVPLFILITCIATFLAVFMSKTKAYVIAPICCFIVTVVGYLIKAELKAGNLWFLHLIPAVLMGVLAVLDFLKVFDKKEAK